MKKVLKYILMFYGSLFVGTCIFASILGQMDGYKPVNEFNPDLPLEDQIEPIQVFLGYQKEMCSGDKGTFDHRWFSWQGRGNFSTQADGSKGVWGGVYDDMMEFTDRCIPESVPDVSPEYFRLREYYSNLYLLRNTILIEEVRRAGKDSRLCQYDIVRYSGGYRPKFNRSRRTIQKEYEIRYAKEWLNGFDYGMNMCTGVDLDSCEGYRMSCRVCRGLKGWYDEEIIYDQINTRIVDIELRHRKTGHKFVVSMIYDNFANKSIYGHKWKLNEMGKNLCTPFRAGPNFSFPYFISSGVKTADDFVHEANLYNIGERLFYETAKDYEIGDDKWTGTTHQF